MSLQKRVNLKRFFIISLPIFGATLYLCHGQKEILANIFVYFAILTNFYMLIQIIEYLAQLAITGNRGHTNKWKVVGFFIGKLLAIIVALTLSVQIMGDRLIIPVLSYVIQIFVLGVSLRR